MKYEFIGWNNKGNHDKVWVCIPLEENKYLVAYGRRGKTLRTKIYDKWPYDMQKLINNKQDKRGYVEVDETKLSSVYPEFESDLETTTMWSALAGVFHA